MKNKPKFKMDLQLFAGDTLFSLKEKLTTIGAELQKVNTDLVEKAANAAIPIDEVTALEERQTNLQKRFNLIKTQYDKMEAEQKASLQKSGITNARTDEARLIAAKAEYIRAKAEKREISAEAKEILNTVTPLQALPTTGNTGQNFLPTTQGKELIHEPFVKNPLRGKIGMTAIAGLELPKIAFTLDNDAFISDGAAAKEIQLTGDTVTFGKNKFKVKVRIADTVLHGSDIDLVSYVENALRSGLAAKEKKVSFASGSDIGTGEGHMSFYEVDAQSASVIKEVKGADLYEAITNAIADLHEDFRENAQVCMKYSDYVTMLKTLANSSTDLFGKKPEEVLGKPVFFSDSATTPIVGDFSYMHLNYDPNTVYDTDKDVDKGEYIWVLTAWFDQQKKLTSAFRLAKVATVPAG